MNYHLSNWNGNLEKKLNTAPKWGIWREEESNELEYRRSRQARGTKTSICQRLLREFPLFIGSLMAPLNRFCSKIKANRNDLCSSLLLIVINRKFLGFEQEKKNLFSHYWHQGSCRSPLNVGLTLFRGRLRCFIDKLLLSKQPLLFPCPLWWWWSGERLPVATSVPPRHRVFPCMNPGAYTLHGWQHKGCWAEANESPFQTEWLHCFLCVKLPAGGVFWSLAFVCVCLREQEGSETGPLAGVVKWWWIEQGCDALIRGTFNLESMATEVCEVGLGPVLAVKN